ncbi:Calcium-dependent channel 7TM region [Lotmaria passim]
MSSTLVSATHYDDQGLFISLVVGVATLVGFGGFMAYLHSTNVLWLKRFYRPNHTIEPPPLAIAPTVMASATADRRGSASRSPISPSSPAEQTIFAEHTVRPHGRSGRAFTRRKRLGVSLPFTSTFFVVPRFRDWISIEEPSLQDRKDGALAPVHYTTAPAPLLHTSDRSFVPIRRVGSPIIPSSPGDVSTFPTEYPTLNPSGGAAATATTTAGTADSNPAIYSPRSRPATPSYGAVEPSSPHRAQQQQQQQSTFSPDVYQAGEPLPKTPTDPLVAIYLFTLKFFLALMFFGELFTLWIMPIARHDDYMRRTMLKRDIHGCGKQDDNETGCEALKPYCRYRGVALGCAVVPLHGIYDLTVSNIQPRSWRWTPVALLNLGFCLVLVVLTLLYLRKVGQYVEAVMANQMRYALGYRVVCIRGLDTTDIRSENALRQNFLQLSVYFPSKETRTMSSAAVPSPNAVERQHRSRNSHITNDSIFAEYFPDDDSYTICECPGLNCLFSTAGMHYYVVRREDATFTEPGKVEQILIAREPPFGLLDTIADTESAMANLQDAIAEEKALRRKLSLQKGTTHTPGAPLRQLRHRRHSGSNGKGCRLHTPAQGGWVPLRATSVVVSGSENSTSACAVAAGGGGGAVNSAAAPPRQRARQAREADEAVLMMRCSFPACCDKMPAVPYYESVFFKRAAELNHMLEQVPHQPVAGAAFVVFKNSLCAFEFMQLFTARFGGLFSSLSATIAGPPGRIFQSSLTAGRCALCLRFFIIFWVYIGLILTWSIPISFLGSLESLSQIPGIGRFLTEFTSLSVTLQSLVNAYLPVVVLALFNVALPYIIRILVRMMGAFNRIECDGGQLYLQYVFMVMTAVIAQAAFQGALTRLADLLFEPNEEAIINFIVACVTPSTGYFYAKIISAACLSTWMDLLDPIGILKALLLRGGAHIQRNYDALFMPCEFEFPRLLSFDLMILSMGLLFHMTAPLLGLLTVVYFFVRYWSQRAKQTDRYRPTLSPAHDCTDFGVPAQAIRSVMWLYCFAETGGVFLMGLRDQSSGVVLCSLSLGVGIALTIYVYIKTRRWTASLACARHFADMPHPYHHTHPMSYQQRQRQQRLKRSGTTPQSPQPPSSASPQQQQQQLRQEESSPSESEPTVTTPLRGSTALRLGVSPAHPATSPMSAHPASSTNGSSSSNNNDNSNRSSLNTDSGSNNNHDAPLPNALFETDPEDNPAERQLSVVQRRNSVLEEGVMEGYEHMTLNQVLFDTSRNPFLSHLLPRKAGVTLRFQPKHQRLAPIDAAAEVRTMHNTDFVVERYWDRGMTWFEEDTADRNWNGAEEGYYSKESSSCDDHAEDNSNSNNSNSPAIANAPSSGVDLSSGKNGRIRMATVACTSPRGHVASTSPDVVVLASPVSPAAGATPSLPLPSPPPLHSTEEHRMDSELEDQPLQRSMPSSTVQSVDRSAHGAERTASSRENENANTHVGE